MSLCAGSQLASVLMSLTWPVQLALQRGKEMARDEKMQRAVARHFVNQVHHAWFFENLKTFKRPNASQDTNWRIYFKPDILSC